MIHSSIKGRQARTLVDTKVKVLPAAHEGEALLGKVSFNFYREVPYEIAEPADSAVTCSGSAALLACIRLQFQPGSTSDWSVAFEEPTAPSSLWHCLCLHISYFLLLLLLLLLLVVVVLSG